MKDNRIYRVIIHADLNDGAVAETLIPRLRRWPDIDLVHHFKADNALIVLAASHSALEAYDLIARLSALPDIISVRARYLFADTRILTPPTYEPRTWLL